MENQNNKSTTKLSNRKIVIGLCTFHRPEMLDWALESLSRIELPEDVAVEFVLVDNDAAGSAENIFHSYQDILPFKSYYFVEPKQGLVYARNRVLEEALKLGATEIAFFDDDEIVSEQWLKLLWDFYKNSFCSGVGGPMYRLLPPGTDKVLLKFWRNSIPHKTGDNCFISPNNCLFTADLVHPDKFNLRFDEYFNYIGGEDGKFAVDAISKGASFLFVKDAITIERFPKQRATFKYLVKRFFGSGSLGPIIMHRKDKKMLRKILFLNSMQLVARTIFIPFSVLRGRFGFWNNIVKLAQSAGAVIGCFGKSYQYYTIKNLKKELKF